MNVRASGHPIGAKFLQRLSPRAFTQDVISEGDLFLAGLLVCKFAQAAALRAFYSGPVWSRHGAAANAAMVNSDNVLLLKPASAVEPFQHNIHRSQENARLQAGGLVVANTCSLAPRTEEEFAVFFSEQALPVIQDAGARIDALLVTDRSFNSFPRLPVREGETVFVWLECHADEKAYANYQGRLNEKRNWTAEIYPWMDSQCWRRIEVVRLTPTPQSLCAW